MPYLNKTIALLNSVLIVNALTFTTPGKIMAYGICETMLKVTGASGEETTERYPAVIDDDGEAQMVEVDDTFDVILYHRLDSITNSVITKTAFGDGQGDLLESANMSLIVFAFRDQIRMPAQSLEAIIKDKFPDNRMPVLDDNNVQLQTSVFRVGNSSFDKLALLQKEYSEIALNFPNIIAFQMNYRIESTWRKGCLPV